MLQANMWLDTFLWGTITFFLGASLGSFLNVYIMRSLRSENYVWGRSQCDHCHRSLQWFELVPVLSYIVLRGRCRTCGHDIDIMHLMMEVVTGSLFVWWLLIGFAFFQLTLQPLAIIQPIFWLIIGVILLLIVIVDWRAYFIPDWTVLALSGLTLTYRLLLISFAAYQVTDLAWALFGAALAMAFLLALWLVTRGRGMGFGDVKLIFALGLLMEWPNVLVGLFAGFVYGAIVGVGLIFTGRGAWRQAIPFAPFLIAGTLTALLWGDSLLRWYFQLL